MAENANFKPLQKAAKSTVAGTQ